MKTVEDVCSDFKVMEGALGAFVCRRGKCLASSLPTNYNLDHLRQIGSGLTRLSQLSIKAGYESCCAAFHWNDVSLFTWPVSVGGVLGVLTLPLVVRSTLELSAALAVEDLSPIMEARSKTTYPPPAAIIPLLPPPRPRSRVEELKLELVTVVDYGSKLEQIEQLMVEEMGPNGRICLRRHAERIIQPGVPNIRWLPILREAVLADINDPGAWATIATSVLWVPESEAACSTQKSLTWKV